MTSKIIKTVEASNIPIEDLTEVVLDGNGVFDKFLTLHRLVLDREFKQARIVGKEYSDAFTQTYIANMEMAIRFLMEKEKQAYEIELLEAQKQQLDLQNELLHSQIEEQNHKNSVLLPLIEEKTKAEIELVRNQAEVSENQAVLTAAEANNAIKQGNLLEEQKCQIKAETTRIIYDTEYKLPEEINAIKKQNLLTQAQMDDVRKGVAIKEYQLSQIMPKELEQLDVQITRLIAEAANVVKQGDLLNAQVCQAEVGVARLRYETEHKLPQEVENLRRQSMLISAQAGAQEKQVELAVKDLTLKDKQILQQDKQLELLVEQLLLQKQKIVTEKAQVDPSVVNSGSIIDTNIKALKAQIEGMDRDAKQKVMNMMVGVFNTRINNDTGEPKPDNYMTDRALASVVKDTLESVGMTILPNSSL